MAMNDEFILELEVEEQLFVAVVHCPFEECEKLLLKLQDINVKNGSGRSLLHVGVRLGKLDWVMGLLSRGADPSIVDNKGYTVLEVAEDMAEKRPKDDDRKMILRFMRVASKVGRNMRKSVEESGRKSNENFDSVLADRSFMRESLAKLQSDMTLLTGEVTSLKSVLGEVKREVHSVVTRRESDTSGQLNTLKKAVEEVGHSLRARDTLLEALETSVTSLAERLALAGEENKRATAELNGAANVIEESDVKCGSSNSLLDSLQASIKSLAELKSYTEPINQTNVLPAVANNQEGTDKAMAEKSSAINVIYIQNSNEKACLRCVEAMTKKTLMYNADNEKTSEVMRYYRILYQRSPLVSCVLSFLARHPLVNVSIDFGCSRVEQMKKDFNDHDGICYANGAHVTSIADFSENRVYLGSKVERCGSSMLANFMKSLTQLALFLAFGNNGRPYVPYDCIIGGKVREILKEACKKKFDEGMDFEWYLHKAVVCRIQTGKEMLLIAAVPAIMVKYGSDDGIEILEEDLPSLRDLYMDHVMPALYKATQEIPEV